jgi:hypothetical protein
MTQETKSYDRQPNETAKAFAAFCIYRDMGVDRSLARTAKDFYPALDSTQKRPRNIAQIEVWSRSWNWVNRCRDYDRDIEIVVREQIKAERGEEYLKKIEQFRSQAETMGTAVIAFNMKFVKSIDDLSVPIFKEITAARSQGRRAILNAEDREFYLQVPNAMRALMTATLSAEELAADGLGLRKLLIDNSDREL